MNADGVQCASNQTNASDMQCANSQMNADVVQCASKQQDATKQSSEHASKVSIASPVGSKVLRGDVEFSFVQGGLSTVKGITCAGVWAGFRRNPARRDFAMVVADVPAVAAGVFTQNRFCAAPVSVSKSHLETQANKGMGTKAIIINSGNANAATGQPGKDVAIKSAELTSCALGCEPFQVLLASTGVIGQQLPLAPFEKGIPEALASLAATNTNNTDVTAAVTNTTIDAANNPREQAATDAATAIMTTDTVPKQAALFFEFNGCKYYVAGMVKGSGMIEPNMATMIGVLATDAPMTQAACATALKLAVDKTLNCVTVDSDTSTNDTVFLLSTATANGVAPGATTSTVGNAATFTSTPTATTTATTTATAANTATATSATTAANTADDKAFNPQTNKTGDLFGAVVDALVVLGEDLARQIAYDGEGATRLVTVTVTGAANDTDAGLAARAVANSPLVKTAIAGHDANWGRIAMAIGKSGATFEQEQVDITIMGIPVCAKGLALPFDEDEALLQMDSNLEICIDVNLGVGQSRARVWSCDMTHDYISINGDYRS